MGLHISYAAFAIQGGLLKNQHKPDTKSLACLVGLRLLMTSPPDDAPAMTQAFPGSRQDRGWQSTDMHTSCSREQRPQQLLQQQLQQPQQGSGSDLAQASAQGPHTNSSVATLMLSPGQVRLLLVCAARGAWVSSTSMQMDGSEVARKPQCHGSIMASILVPGRGAGSGHWPGPWPRLASGTGASSHTTSQHMVLADGSANSSNSTSSTVGAY